MKKNKILILPLIVFFLDLVLFVLYGFLFFFLYHSFLYPQILDWELLITMWLYIVAPGLISAGYIVVYLILNKCLKEKFENIVSALVISLVALVVLLSYSVSSVILMSFASPVGSQTTSLEDYLVIDEFIEENWSDSYDFFPEEISESAEEIHYFYRYRQIVESDFDFYLKVTVSEEDFLKEKERIEKYYPEAQVVNNEKREVEYRISYEEYDPYYYRFIVFSESDLTIEYVSSYSLEGREEGRRPYFEEIEK